MKQEFFNHKYFNEVLIGIMILKFIYRSRHHLNKTLEFWMHSDPGGDGKYQKVYFGNDNEILITSCQIL